MTRITLVLFLLSRDDDASSSTVVVVFYRDVMPVCMQQLWGKMAQEYSS
jgi:hypothetical protein